MHVLKSILLETTLFCVQEMARYLVVVDNASVNAQDNAGWTPLHEACCSRHLDIAELLLKAGADANMSATDGTR